jgi:multiple sugar transport system ATP-binding protein
MAAVTFRDVDKRFGDVSVIEDMNLEIHDHEFMVLVGPSGCGKSTALRLVAGLEEVSSGTIAIGEQVVNDLPPKDRDIAMVFQNYALYPHMSIRENLEFGLKMRKVPAAEIARLVGEAADVLGLIPYLDRKPKQLSGGQKQRVAVGRAIVRKPSVFLFDEPLSNLDAKLRIQMRAEIKKLQHSLKTTTLYVTHDQVEAMTMGSRIAVMRDGKIQQVGTPLEIYERPVNLFVAAFIGTPPMNFLQGVVNGGSLVIPGGSLPLPAKLRGNAGPEGKRVIAGIRPENVLGPGEEARGATGQLRLEIEVVEPLGDEVVVHGKVGDAAVVCKLDPHHVPEIGTELDATVEIENMHLFDAETEKRLGD